MINNPVPVCPCPWRLWARAERPGLGTEEKYLLPSPRWAGKRKGGFPEEWARMEQKWEVSSGTRGSGVSAKALQAGKEAEHLQTELMSTDLGWALREVRSDSFFSLFFSSRGNLS